MKSPPHPMDKALDLRGWQRARADDLGGETKKLPGRLICRSPHLSDRVPIVLAVIDVHLWWAGSQVRMDLATPHYPPFLETLVVQGIQGQSPLGLGLAPCHHSDQLWNPLCLPLIWQPAMDVIPNFAVLVRRYERLIAQPRWQCPDYRPLTV